GDVALAVDHVEPVRPRSVGLFRGVLEVVDDGGNAHRQFGGASSLHRAAFGKSRGAHHRNLIFLVVVILPCVNRVCFQNIDHIEGGAIFVTVVELIERGNLPAKGWSSVAPEYQHHGLLPSKGGKRNR